MAHLRLPPPDGIIEWHSRTRGQFVCPRVGSIRVSAPGMMQACQGGADHFLIAVQRDRP